MKISFPALFKADLNKYKFFFIHGNDLVVFERSIVFLNKKFSCPIEVKSEKELLADSGLQQSLFENNENKSLILISNVSDKIINHLDQIGKGIYIFTSEKARSQSKLVTYFASSSQSLAISAYASPLIPAEFEFLVGNLHLSVQFRGLLFKTYQNDYMGLLDALEKIKLYGDVSESMYSSFLESQATEDDLKMLVHSFLLKNLKKVSGHLLMVNPSDIISLLRTLTRSFQILYSMMPFKKNPQAISWQNLPSPVFFKDQPIYQSALSHWSVEQVLFFLESLLKLEYKVKYERLTFSQVSQELMRGVES